MKIKFKSSLHRKYFTEFISGNVENPYASRNEFIAAVFLLSADKFLWKRSASALTGYSVNFDSINLSGISTEGYALFTAQTGCLRRLPKSGARTRRNRGKQAAKGIYRGGADISLNELCDRNLIDDAVLMTVFAGVMLLRNGFVMLNWRSV